ncbi:MAG: type II and III secretion system protein family protein [Deltaproteobacteria bacterium]|nr:type II and III secretion system protein family protein [Deltaproteobacteria bacterium]
MNRLRGSAAILLLACFGFLCPQPVSAAFKMGVEGASAKQLHLQSNQSFLIDADLRIKRVSVGKPEIADVTVVTPRQLLVTAKSPGTTTLIYWNEQGLPTSMDVNVEKETGVRGDLQKLAPGEKFEISGPPDTMILSGKVSTDTAQQRLVEAAKAYSKNVVNLMAVERLEQIMLQVRVAEVDRNVARELGFGVLTEQNSIRGSLSPGNAFTPFFGNLRDQQPGDIGPNFTFSDAVNLFVAKPGAFPKFAGLIRALHDKGALRTLAEPNLVVANGGEGKFLAGGEFPVVYSTAAAGGSAVSVSYKEFGVRLNFQPKIAPNGEIYLKIAQEVSELDFANAVVLTGFRIPALRSRKAESSVQLADGQSFVLAGLIDNKISKQVSKIPLLGDIPVLGTLFRSTRYQNNETELMVMVTPRIVRPMEKGKAPQLPTEKMDPGETSPSLVW